VAHRRVYTPLMCFRHWSEPPAAQQPRAACRHKLAQRPARQPQSAVPRSLPSVTHIMGYYSFNRPRRDGRLSWPCWLTDSGRFTRKVVTRPSISLAQDTESPPTRTDVLTTMLRNQLQLGLRIGPTSVISLCKCVFYCDHMCFQLLSLFYLYIC